MTREEIQSKTIEIISLKSGKPIKWISLNSHMAHDIGFDSLDMIELENDLESEFFVQIELTEKFMPTTVGELVENVINSFKHGGIAIE